ncbi:hypothetical protein D3C86_713580 [compost metagenome]
MAAFRAVLPEQLVFRPIASRVRGRCRRHGQFRRLQLHLALYERAGDPRDHRRRCGIGHGSHCRQYLPAVGRSIAGRAGHLRFARDCRAGGYPLDRAPRAFHRHQGRQRPAHPCDHLRGGRRRISTGHGIARRPPLSTRRDARRRPPQARPDDRRPAHPSAGSPAHPGRTAWRAPIADRHADCRPRASTRNRGIGRTIPPAHPAGAQPARTGRLQRLAIARCPGRRPAWAGSGCPRA